MERLTLWADMGLNDWEQIHYKVSFDPEGAYNILDLAFQYGQDGDIECANILQDISIRLKAYEDICPTPEKLKEIDKMYLKKCEEVNRLKERLQVSREGDLISRKALEKAIRDYADKKCCHGETELASGILKSLSVVKNQPTAYDVDKVEEQIKNECVKVMDMRFDEDVCNMFSKGAQAMFQRAWDAVKGGGVDEKGVL